MPTPPQVPPPVRGNLGMRRYGYGYLLVLILVTLSFQLAAPDRDWAQALTILLQAATLVVAALASRATHIVIRAAVMTAVAIVVVSAIAFTISGTVDDGAARIVNALLIAIAPPTIAVGIVRHVREEGLVTVRTMFGVLCIYLLVGMFFATCYGAEEAIGSKPFFAQTAHADVSDFLYFSFATITTTGFGDLTAATDLGRSLAITEALIGQIYLVTVVALIVTNIGRAPGRRRRDA